jgi:PAS domain S-box-containing protein
MIKRAPAPSGNNDPVPENTGQTSDTPPGAQASMPADCVSILVVDDRPENLLALEAILEPLGHRLIRAQSGEQALRALLDNDIAVILLDVQMPGMSGLETARIIKSRERTRFIPIVFLTAISKDDEYVFEAYSVGAVDYMFKPFQPQVLRSKVAALVDLHLRQRQVAAQEQQLREAERQAMQIMHMRALLQSEARYRDILRSARDAVITFDGEGRITMFNIAAERMFGTRAADALGESVERLFAGAPGTLLDRLRSAGRSGSGAMVGSATDGGAPKLFARRANGERFPIEATVSTPDIRAEEQMYTLIVRDISDRVRHEEALRRQAHSLARSTEELKQLNDELNRRQAELERAMTARNRFYASMSHELRTPINAVLGYSTLLLERIYGPLNDKQVEGIERTQRAARHLLELVNDVLDLSKIEAGKIDLRLQPVSIHSLIEDLFVTVRPLADEHGSRLTCRAEEGEISVTTDPRRVRQILLNLLSNAIKFGAGKPIEVTCERGDGRGVIVTVADQGPGIPQEDQERIFQEFVQLGHVQLQGGTGLGLSISRRLAEILGGTLTLQSVPGDGCRFHLSLPQSIEDRERVTEQVTEQERPIRRSEEASRASAGRESRTLM